MIIFAMFTFSSDTQVASQLIIGGVSLITIILTAYTAFATIDDRWHWRPYGDSADEPTEEYSEYGEQENLTDDTIDTLKQTFIDKLKN